MKQEIQVWDYAGTILAALPKGVLLTTRSGDTCNTMTIGWGQLGIEWGKPIFTAYVRKSRFTRTLLDRNPEFTISIPMGEIDREILRVCGTRSGRDMDKFATLGLTREGPLKITVPGIRQLPLTLECRVLYRQDQTASALPADLVVRYYPPAENGQPDDHIAFYGEILAAYLIQ